MDQKTGKIIVEVNGGVTHPAIEICGGSRILFRIKESTQLRKLMAAYRDRTGLGVGGVSFVFGGRRLRDHQTPKEINMKEGDVIHALLHMRGS